MFSIRTFSVIKASLPAAFLSSHSFRRTERLQHQAFYEVPSLPFKEYNSWLQKSKINRREMCTCGISKRLTVDSSIAGLGLFVISEAKIKALKDLDEAKK